MSTNISQLLISVALDEDPRFKEMLDFLNSSTDRNGNVIVDLDITDKIANLFGEIKADIEVMAKQIVDINQILLGISQSIGKINAKQEKIISTPSQEEGGKETNVNLEIDASEEFGNIYNEIKTVTEAARESISDIADKILENLNVKLIHSFDDVLDASKLATMLGNITGEITKSKKIFSDISSAATRAGAKFAGFTNDVDVATKEAKLLREKYDETNGLLMEFKTQVDLIKNQFEKTQTKLITKMSVLGTASKSWLSAAKDIKLNYITKSELNKNIDKIIDSIKNLPTGKVDLSSLTPKFNKLTSMVAGLSKEKFPVVEEMKKVMDTEEFKKLSEMQQGKFKDSLKALQKNLTETKQQGALPFKSKSIMSNFAKANARFIYEDKATKKLMIDIVAKHFERLKEENKISSEEDFDATADEINHTLRVFFENYWKSPGQLDKTIGSFTEQEFNSISGLQNLQVSLNDFINSLKKDTFELKEGQNTIIGKLDNIKNMTPMKKLNEDFEEK